MTKYNSRFLSSVLVMGIFGITNTVANAAPSVRMLGTNSARIGTNATVVKSESDTAAPTQRLGTIRSKTVNSVAPVTVNKVATPSVAADSDANSRLSLGKYIHSAGLSTGPINAGVASGDFVALSDQVRDLKDSKQDVISVGDGLEKSGATISLSSETVASLDLANSAVQPGDLNNYYTKEEIGSMISGLDVENLNSSIQSKADKAYVTSAITGALNAYYTKGEVNSQISQLNSDISGKANAATSLAGYGIQDAYTKSEVDAAISGIFEGDVSAALNGKQDTINDLGTIRSNAALGATAVQSADLADQTLDINARTLKVAGSAVLTQHQDISGKLNSSFDNLSAEGKAKVASEGTYDSNTSYAAGTIGAAIKGKANAATSLAGYGIQDAYTKNYTDSTFAKKSDVYTKGAVDDMIDVLDSKITSAVAGDLSSELEKKADKDYVTSAVTSAIEGLNATKSQSASSTNGYLNLSVTQSNGEIAAVSGSVDLTSALDGYAKTNDVTSAVTSAIEGLDSSVTQSADSSNGYLTLSVTQTDGEIASVSGSVDLTSALDGYATTGYVTSAVSGLISNPTRPSENGSYLLMATRDGDTYTYSWTSAGNISGGGSSPSGNYVECDPSCPSIEWACIPCD